jgi:hypothetical protein
MITFRSEVGPDVMMFDAVAQRLMTLIAKEHAARGVISVEQLPAAIAALKTAIAQDRAVQRAAPAAADSEDEDDGAAAAAAAPVSLAQGATPLVELLEISLAREKPVTWGV